MEEIVYVTCNFCDEIRMVEQMDLEDETDKIYCQSESCKNHFGKEKGSKMDAIGFLGEKPWACSYCDCHDEALAKGVCERGRSMSFSKCGI